MPESTANPSSSLHFLFLTSIIAKPLNVNGLLEMFNAFKSKCFTFARKLN